MKSIKNYLISILLITTAVAFYSCSNLLLDLEKKNVYKNEYSANDLDLGKITGVSSGDPDIVEVKLDSQGHLIINSVGYGTTTVTVRDKDGKTKKIEVTVETSGKIITKETDSEGAFVTTEYTSQSGVETANISKVLKDDEGNIVYTSSSTRVTQPNGNFDEHGTTTYTDGTVSNTSSNGVKFDHYSEVIDIDYSQNQNTNKTNGRIESTYKDSGEYEKKEETHFVDGTSTVIEDSKEITDDGIVETDKKSVRAADGSTVIEEYTNKSTKKTDGSVTVDVKDILRSENGDILSEKNETSELNLDGTKVVTVTLKEKEEGLSTYHKTTSTLTYSSHDSTLEIDITSGTVNEEYTRDKGVTAKKETTYTSTSEPEYPKGKIVSVETFDEVLSNARVRWTVTKTINRETGKEVIETKSEILNSNGTTPTDSEKEVLKKKIAIINTITITYASEVQDISMSFDVDPSSGKGIFSVDEGYTTYTWYESDVKQQASSNNYEFDIVSAQGCYTILCIVNDVGDHIKSAQITIMFDVGDVVLSNAGRKFTATTGFDSYTWFRNETKLDLPSDTKVYDMPLDCYGEQTVYVVAYKNGVQKTSERITINGGVEPNLTLSYDNSKKLVTASDSNYQTYDSYNWFINGVEVSGETGNTLSLAGKEHGEYLVKVEAEIHGHKHTASYTCNVVN